MQYIYIHIYTFLVKYCYCAISNAANIHIPYEILLFRTLECKKYTVSLTKGLRAHVLSPAGIAKRFKQVREKEGK